MVNIFVQVIRLQGGSRRPNVNILEMYSLLMDKILKKQNIFVTFFLGLHLHFINQCDNNKTILFFFFNTFLSCFNQAHAETKVLH